MKADFKKWLEENNMYKKYTVSASWVINQFAENYAEKEAIDFGYKLLHDVRCDLGSDNMPDTWTKEDVKYKYQNQNKDES